MGRAKQINLPRFTRLNLHTPTARFTANAVTLPKNFSLKPDIFLRYEIQGAQQNNNSVSSGTNTTQGFANLARIFGEVKDTTVPIISTPTLTDGNGMTTGEYNSLYALAAIVGALTIVLENPQIVSLLTSDSGPYGIFPVIALLPVLGIWKGGRWVNSMSIHDAVLFNKLILKNERFPGYYQILFRQNDVFADYEVGRGFGLIVKGKKTVIQIKRGSNIFMIQRGEWGGLRNNDIVRINGEEPFVFVDMAYILNPFRAGYRYPGRMPKEVSMAASHAKQNNDRFFDIVFSDANESPAQIAFLKTSGWHLRPQEGKGILVISDHGKKVSNLNGKASKGQSASNNSIEIKNGFVVQLGDDPPFVVDNLPEIKTAGDKRSSRQKARSPGQNTRAGGASRDTPPRNDVGSKPWAVNDLLLQRAYQDLGLKLGATPRKIRMTFRGLLRKQHRHLNPGDPKAADAKVRDLLQAYKYIREKEGW